jgi:hypothetical protein
MAELKRYVVSYEGGGEMRLLLSSEQASEYRKDPAVKSVSVEKERPPEADVAAPRPFLAELSGPEKEAAGKARREAMDKR